MDPQREDFSLQDIDETYQKVLHLSDDGFIVDGTGSLVTIKLSGSIDITSSYAISSSHAITASYVETVATASYASLAETASYSLSSSLAETASYSLTSLNLDQTTPQEVTGGTPIFEDIEFSTMALGTPTYKSIKDYIDLGSAGFITSSGITSNGDGSITVGAGTGIIKMTDSEHGANKFFDWAENTSVVLTDNSVNWIYVDYNTSTEAITAAATTDISTIDLHTEIMIGRVYRAGTELWILNGLGQDIDDYITESCYKDFEIYGFQRASGLITTESGTRGLDITAGAGYCAHNRYELDALNTNTGGDTFQYVYRNGSGGWTFDDNGGLGYTQVSNILYDDNDGTPANIDNNKYATYYVYYAFNESGSTKKLYVQMGQTKNNDLKKAEAEQPPTPPALLRDMCKFIAKIIIKKNDTNFTEVANPFAIQFMTSAAPVHNELGGLQGGTADEYYHLTADEYSALGNVNIKRSATDGLITYMAYAPEGSDESAAVWAITKIVTTAIGGVTSAVQTLNWKWTEYDLL